MTAKPTPKICGTCRSWHKRRNYACQHNGYWGGGLKGVENCNWKPKLEQKP